MNSGGVVINGVYKETVL